MKMENPKSSDWDREKKDAAFISCVDEFLPLSSRWMNGSSEAPVSTSTVLTSAAVLCLRVAADMAAAVLSLHCEHSRGFVCGEERNYLLKWWHRSPPPLVCRSVRESLVQLEQLCVKTVTYGNCKWLTVSTRYSIKPALSPTSSLLALRGERTRQTLSSLMHCGTVHPHLSKCFSNFSKKSLHLPHGHRGAVRYKQI